MIDKRPLMIARCSDVADVITAVNFRPGGTGYLTRKYGLTFCGVFLRRIAVREKVIVRGRKQNERIGSRFRDDGAQRITAGGCIIVQRATNDPVFGLGFALRGTELGLD